MMRTPYMDMHRALVNKGFFAAVALVFTVYAMDGVNTLWEGGGEAFSFYVTISDIGSLKWMLPCLGTLCYADAYVRERNSLFTRYAWLRCPLLKYAASKVVACAISAMLATMAGLWLFILFARIRLGVFVNAQSVQMYADPAVCLDSLIIEGRYICYLFFRILYQSASAGMWAVFGLALSALWTNRYVALFSPAVLAYFKDYLWEQMSVQPPIRLKNLEMAQLMIPGVFRPTVITLGVFGGMTLLLGFCFFIGVRRQMHHG